MADLSNTESFQYPAAHYGHLTEHQQEQLDAFRALCLEKGYYTPAGTGSNAEPSHDDETLLRFLRARRFNPQEAFGQFKATEEWRREHGVDELYKTMDIEEYEQTRRLYPQWLGRRDRRGIPVFLFEVAPLNSKNISAYEKHLKASASASPAKVTSKSLRLFSLYESLTGFVQPLCTAMARKHPETPISQSNNLVDISGVGLKQFWNLKGHMQEASQLATAHYPETLDRIFIIGAPAFFPTVWGWIKRWFDPITVSKIFILSHAEVFPTLSQYIDPDNIPTKYGGNLDFKWTDMPHIEPEIDAAIEWINPNVQHGKNTLPIGPITWQKNDDGSLTAVAIGTEKGAPRNTPVFRIANPVNFSKANVGQTIPNTPICEAELALTTVGTATQPADPDPATVDLDSSPSGTPAPSEAPSESQDLPNREGTSQTRFIQQNKTHAAGQLSEGTPDAAVNDHGHGDKTVTMEPATVGQAPKDVSIKPEEPAAPTLLEQAKQVATHAASTVTGLAVVSKVQGKGEAHAPEKSAAQKEIDAKIDAKAGPVIESFLREKTSSRNA